ncbi:MDR family MFS transporter [Agrilactobacillus fermenti]|uniref:MDR family MFS transporter n=1 Tax=Agrilactobacillus fermenti TaxID=2586909 RepID=UPI001E38F41F|nr:MFS transporter [Agrilactobacillus fermenti]MCD2255391.1 MFS transporter [Agrilactobacillus fermenti]
MREIKLPWLLAGALLSSTGMSFIWPLTSVYLHNRLGINLTLVGLVLLFNSLASVIGDYLGGYLYDHYNPYRLLLSGILLTMSSLLALVFWHNWPIFGVLLFTLGLGQGWNLTLVNAIGTSIHNHDGRYVFNMLYFAQNLGAVLGASLVGYVYSFGVTWLFIIALVLFIFFYLIVAITYRPIAHIQRHHAKSNTKKPVVALPKGNHWLVLTFLIALLLIWIMYQQWVSNLSVYMTTLHIPLSKYSLLWTLNAGLIVIIQLLLNWLGHHFQNLFIQIEFGIFMVALSFGSLIFAKGYSSFVLAMIILTIGEATAFPAIPALVNLLTPTASKGKYQGLLNAFGAAGRALGPLLGGIIIEHFSYMHLFIIALSTIMFVWLGIFLVWHLVQHHLTYYDHLKVP